MPSTVLDAGTINEVDVALVLMQHTDWWWQIIKETGKYVITPAFTQRCCKEREVEWENSGGTHEIMWEWHTCLKAVKCSSWERVKREESVTGMWTACVKTFGVTKCGRKKTNMKERMGFGIWMLDPCPLRHLSFLGWLTSGRTVSQLLNLPQMKWSKQGAARWQRLSLLTWNPK